MEDLDAQGNRVLDTQVLGSSAEDYETSSADAASGLADKDSGIMIAWYCFIGVSALVLSFVLITCSFKSYYNRVQLPAQRARRAAHEAAREAALARMQANVSKFTAHENTQRTRDMCAMLLPQTTEVGVFLPRIFVTAFWLQLRTTRKTDQSRTCRWIIFAKIPLLPSRRRGVESS